MSSLNINDRQFLPEKDWAKYWFGDTFHSSASPKQFFETLLRPYNSPQALEIVKNIFKLSESRSNRTPRQIENKWKRLFANQGATRFIDMLLAGEICASLTDIEPKYGIESLASAIDGAEDWYQIRGGSELLVSSLEKTLENKGAKIQLATPVDTVKTTKQGVIVRHSAKKNGEQFDAVIITTPKGDELLGNSADPYHSYISVLIECGDEPKLKSKEKALLFVWRLFGLSSQLYSASARP